MATTFKVKGGGKYRKRLEGIAREAGVVLKVGVLAGATDAQGEPIAPRAYYNEFGTAHIPPRPAFRNTVDAKAANWAQGLTSLVRGRMAEAGVVKNAFQQLGEVMKEDIQDTIGSGVGPALAESTVKAKTRKGLAAPALQLVEDADYQNSIKHEVKKK